MTQARVFSVTHQDADTAPDVVTGMISVFDRDAHILIDPGATHSFISMGFMLNVNVESQPIDCSIVVSLPTGDSQLAESVYMDSRVIIGGQEFLADLILLDIHDFDVILGMHWLSRHHATMDCYRKDVRFCRPEETEVVFYGLWKTLPNSIMTAMKASKMLRKPYQEYLAYAIEVRDSGSLLENIPVVREFPNVFPKDLPGIPPDREIDFHIELALGTEPVTPAGSRSDPIGGSGLKSEAQYYLYYILYTILYWDSHRHVLSQSCTCTCSIQTISVITKIIYIYKRTTTGVVSIKIYTHIQSPIYLYMYIFYYKTLEIAEAALVSTYL